MNELNYVKCPKCGQDTWYYTQSDHIECTQCKEVIPVEPMPPLVETPAQ